LLGLLDPSERSMREPRGIGRYFPPRLFVGDHVIHDLVAAELVSVLGNRFMVLPRL
jgi:hypothetical protein